MSMYMYENSQGIRPLPLTGVGLLYLIVSRSPILVSSLRKVSKWWKQFMMLFLAIIHMTHVAFVSKHHMVWL